MLQKSQIIQDLGVPQSLGRDEWDVTTDNELDLRNRLGPKVVIRREIEDISGDKGCINCWLVQRRYKSATLLHFPRIENHCANMRIFLAHPSCHPNQLPKQDEKHLTPAGYNTVNTPD